MKWRKITILSCSILALIVMFSCCYYVSYLHALKNFNQGSKEQKQELTSYLESVSPNDLIKAADESVPVDGAADDIVTSNTLYRLETYDISTNETSIETMNPPAKFIGKNREEIIRLISDEMKNMPLEEHQKGLVSYVLISFSEDEMVLRKTYNMDIVQYKYYIALQNGIVIVYYSDKKTVFDYTGIDARTLSDSVQSELSIGKYVKDDEELYALLEGYTS